MRKPFTLARAIIPAMLIPILLLSTVLPGCTGKQQAHQTSGDKVAITDCIGRQVQVPRQVRRIACIYAFSGHVVTLLGKGDEIVAVNNGLKRDVLLNQINPAIKQALEPATTTGVNVEELLKANPDVVFVQPATSTGKGDIDALKNSGLPCLVVTYSNIKEQMYAIDMIGKAIGAEDQAKRYNAYYQQCIDRVQARVKNIHPAQRLRVFHSVNEATRTDTKDSLPADWIPLAGAVSVSGDQPLKLIDDAYYASLEQILLWDPDVIMANESGVADYIMHNKQWAPLSAVINHRVYQMPNGVSRWGRPGSVETPLGLLWAAKTLYPDLFQDLDLSAETKQFYQDYFHYSLSDQMVTQILSGTGMRVPKGQ